MTVYSGAKVRRASHLRRVCASEAGDKLRVTDHFAGPATVILRESL